MAEGLTKEQIKEIVEDDDFNVEEMRELLKEEFDEDLPEDLTVEQIVEFVFKAYEAKAAEVSKVRAEKRTQSKAAKKKSGEGDGGGVSRSGFVEGFIKDAGPEGTTRALVEKALDEAFGYTLAGKKPKTRVNRVLRNLGKKNLVEVDGQKIRWVG